MTPADTQLKLNDGAAILGEWRTYVRHHGCWWCLDEHSAPSLVDVRAPAKVATRSRRPVAVHRPRLQSDLVQRTPASVQPRPRLAAVSVALLPMPRCLKAVAQSWMPHMPDQQRGALQPDCASRVLSWLLIA